MILENGVIRTMDASLPTQRALAIAGDRVAGGIGTHETALASPEVVDLGGRCVLPGFTDSHVHFPTWALALRQVRLEGVSALGEALERVKAAVPGVPAGNVLRGFGWRDADWAEAPTKEALDAVTGSVPAALFAHDYHSLWVNSATLALADGDLEVAGGVVERDESGEPTGVLREEAAWQFRERYLTAPDDEYVDAMREGLRVAAARGVTAVHDKDGWLGAARFWGRLHEQEALTLRVWQSLPHEHLDRVVEAGLPQGLGDSLSQSRLPQGLHGRHARFADRAHARRVRRGDHERRAVGGHRHARGRGGLAGGSARDRRSRQPGGARCLRADAGALAPARAASSHRACAVRRRGGPSSLCRSRRRRLGPVQPCPV